MLGGLYGDLPPPSSTTDNDNTKSTNASSSTPSVWSSSAKMAPAAFRKPASILAPPHSVLKSHNKPKPSPVPKAVVSSSHMAVLDVGLMSNSVYQPALVGVNAHVVEEYDPARANDYESYREERKRKAAEAEVRRQEEDQKERERREREREAERERREREREAERDKDREARLNISGEEAWQRRAALSGGGGAVPPRSHSPPSNPDGFSIGKSETVGLGVGVGGQMTAAQRMMAKMGWKQGEGLGQQEQGITTPLMAKKPISVLG